MKRIVAILFSIFIILSGAHMSFAVHYCGGQVAATKVSLTHALASCGMATDKQDRNNTGFQISSNCCVDKVSNLVVDSNYFPTDILLKCKTSSHSLILFVLAENLHQKLYNTSKAFEVAKPPDEFTINSVSLPDICVFRI